MRRRKKKGLGGNDRQQESKGSDVDSDHLRQVNLMKAMDMQGMKKEQFLVVSIVTITISLEDQGERWSSRMGKGG